MIYCCNVAFKLLRRLNSDSVKTEKNKTKTTTAKKVFQSFIKGKLWILVYIEPFKRTFHFAPKSRKTHFLKSRFQNFLGGGGGMPLDRSRGMVPSEPASWPVDQIPAYQIHNTGCQNY